MVLSMLATPFIIMYSNRIVMKLVSSEWLQQSLQMTTIARKSINANKHVIICGYGRSGQNMARMLEREGIPYMALDLDPDRVRQAAAAGDSVVFGDAARLQALMAAGLARASAVVVTYLDTAGRPQGAGQHPRTCAAGAGDCAHPGRPGSRKAAGCGRHRGGAGGHRRLADAGQPCAGTGGRAHAPCDPCGAGPARCALQPAARLFHGADDDTVNELDHERLGTFTLPLGAKSIGEPLGIWRCMRMGVRVVSLRRVNGKAIDLASNPPLADSDTLVLSGKPAALAVAEKKLMQG
jgi:CPA2 family monovalent cation:H+ antiporter-2